MSELEPEVLKALNSGRKIEAIKTLRALRGIGLKEAKELVDAYSDQHNLTDSSVQKVSSNNGIVAVIFLGVVGFLIYHFLLQ